MVIRADDFKDRSLFTAIVEEAQDKGIVPQGPISWDEGDSVIDLDNLELNVSPTGLN